MKKEVIGTIKGSDLIINSKNKLNKSDPIVRSGTGFMKDKGYSRKQKHKKNYKSDY